MITAQGLTKRYGDVLAVDNVDLQVNAGEIFGFLGPNGAGKSTVFKAIFGLLNIQSGRVLLDAEMDAPVVDEIRDVIAASPVAADITDLHVWRVGKGKYACILALSAPSEASPDQFRRQLGIHEELVHVTVELNPRRPGTACA